MPLPAPRPMPASWLLLASGSLPAPGSLQLDTTRSYATARGSAAACYLCMLPANVHTARHLHDATIRLTLLPAKSCCCSQPCCCPQPYLRQGDNGLHRCCITGRMGLYSVGRMHGCAIGDAIGCMVLIAMHYKLDRMNAYHISCWSHASYSMHISIGLAAWPRLPADVGWSWSGGHA
ncbi:hypothetical protein Dimus_030388 [Dionaea muscipula]